MAAGLVPVVSEMTGTKELLEGIEPALVAEDTTAAGKILADLMQDPARLKELSLKCRAAVKGWDKARAIRDFKAAFKESIGGTGDEEE
jgi:hypothetical protein